MIAYNPMLIRNISIVKKSKEWFNRDLISADQMDVVLNKYSIKFYSPNLFVKIGLFIFTFFAICAAYGTYALIFIQAFSGMASLVFSCFLYSVFCVFALEFFIKDKNLYSAGVDECLLYAALGFSFVAISIMIEYDFELFSYKTMLLHIFFVPFLIVAIVRYADRFVAFLLALCLYFIFFLLLLKMGEIAKRIIPFALMVLSVSVYRTSKKYQKIKLFQNWKNCFVVFEYTALFVFYLAGNYYVIRESSIAFFGLTLTKGEDIPLALVFYFFTAVVPFAYVYYGLKNKDKVLLWVGLFLIAVAALTFKNYFSLGRPEIAITLAGFIMIVIAYVSIRLLKASKHGITFEEEFNEDNFLRSNVEAMVISQKFGQQAQITSNTKFGGGDFGGGGAGANF